MFNFQGGDLIGFIMKNPRIEGLLLKYQFFQIANLCNILETVADKEALLYLS